MPVLQFIPPAELQIDDEYQRDLATGPSKTLIRKIAQFWNWDLCQPLVVARRSSGELFVIDGQHRLEASKLRSDIMQLPCVVVEYANLADEAASFVHLNQQRRPLSKLDLFKAAVASEDPEACAILAALTDAGLSVAPHTNYVSWKPGMVSNIAGIENAWRCHGADATKRALGVLAQAYRGEVLRYAGTIFPGLVAVCATEKDGPGLDLFAKLVGNYEQVEWRTAIAKVRVEDPNIKFAKASAKVFKDAWRLRADPSVDKTVENSRPVAQVHAQPLAPDDDGKRWCDQCDMRVTHGVAILCTSQFCSVRAMLKR